MVHSLYGSQFVSLDFAGLKAGRKKFTLSLGTNIRNSPKLIYRNYISCKEVSIGYADVRNNQFSQIIHSFF